MPRATPIRGGLEASPVVLTEAVANGLSLAATCLVIGRRSEPVESGAAISDRGDLANERQFRGLRYGERHIESEAHGTLAHLDDCWRLRCDRFRHRHRRRYRLTGVCKGFYQAPPMRFFSGPPLPCVNQAAGLTITDGPNEALHMCETGQVDFRPAEECVCRRNAKVACKSELATPTNGVSVDCRDHREPSLLEAPVHLIVMPVARNGVSRRGRLQLVDIEASGKHPRPTGQYGDANSLFIQFVQRTGQLIGEGRADGVDGRVRKGQYADVTVDTSADEILGGGR